MENGHLHDDKLFRAVHDRLSDYEAPYNGADWDAMSRSLDQLPKTARFQWKFSLNTLLIAIGVAGLSVIGYAFASHSGNTAAPKPEAVKTETPVRNTSMASNTPVVVTHNDAVPAANTDVSLQQEQQQAVAMTDNSSALNNGSSTQKRKQTKLLFGDQIDPKKGFIYNTQEDPAILNHVKNTAGGPYYTVDGKGDVKQLDVQRDTTGSMHAETKDKPFFSDTTTTNSFSRPGAPSGGD